MPDIDTSAAPVADRSTVLDKPSVTENGAGAQPIEKPGSVRDAVAKAFDDVVGAEPEEQAKVEPDKGGEKPVTEKPVSDVKPEKVENANEADKQQQVNGKPAAKDQPEPGDKGADASAGTGQEAKPRQSEGRHEPPARFLPRAKEQWANVPNAVKAEIARLSQEFETETASFKSGADRDKELAEFHEMAKQSGTTLKEAVTRYTQMESLLRSNPVQGIAEVLRNIGVTPEQYAQYVLQNPQAHAAQPRPDAAQVQTSNEIKALQAEIQSMRQDQAARHAEETIIAPFRAKNPRFQELQGDIEFFLSSGKIPASLSPLERLEAAYDMAERINPMPRSMSRDEDVPKPSADQEPAVDLRGQKSVRGAPSGGFDPAQNGRAKTRKSAIESSLAEFGL